VSCIYGVEGEVGERKSDRGGAGKKLWWLWSGESALRVGAAIRDDECCSETGKANKCVRMGAGAILIRGAVDPDRDEDVLRLEVISCGGCFIVRQYKYVVWPLLVYLLPRLKFMPRLTS